MYLEYFTKSLPNTKKKINEIDIYSGHDSKQFSLTSVYNVRKRFKINIQNNKL